MVGQPADVGELLGFEGKYWCQNHKMSTKYPSGYDKRSVVYLDLEFRGDFGGSNFGNY